MSAQDHLNEDQFSYRMQHQPAFGSGIHEADKEMPDIYEHPEYYEFGDPAVDSEAHHALYRTRGNPDQKIPIYRSAPKGVHTINPGDWVTTSPTYAKQHGMGAADDGGDWPVQKAMAKAHEVSFGGNDAVEWGYTGVEPKETMQYSRGRKGKKR